MRTALLACPLCLALVAIACGDTRPATKPATRPSVEIRYAVYLARIESHTTVSPDGTLERRRTHNQRYGDGEGRWTPTWETRRGTLTAAQAEELARLLDAVAAWPGETFASGPDDADVRVRIGDRVIRGGRGEPPAIRDLRTTLDRWAAAMPVVTP